MQTHTHTHTHIQTQVCARTCVYARPRLLQHRRDAAQRFERKLHEHIATLERTEGGMQKFLSDLEVLAPAMTSAWQTSCSEQKGAELVTDL